MRGYFLLSVFGMLLLTHGDLCAQPAVAVFYYCPAPNDPVLGCPCENANPFPDGTLVSFFHDVNLNGPDDADTLLMYGTSHYEWYCWTPDGPLTILESGAGMHVFLMVNGGACCWTTIDYLIVPGYQEIWIAGTDWTCVDISCEFLRADDPAQMPQAFRITSVYPNPFNSKTQIEFDLPQTGSVTIEIYNIAGQRVRTLAHNTFPAGVHHLTWDARSDVNLPVGSGVYLCRAISHGSSVAKKLLLLQ